MARKMKDSGVEWIGEIPENWEVKPLKQILIERKEKNDPIKTNEILSLSIERGVFPYSEKVGGGNKAKEDLSAYKLAYPDDIVLNSMNVIVGAVGLSKYFGCVSPVYYTLHPRTSDYDIHYYSNIFQSSAFQKSLMGYGNGIMMKESDNGKLNTIRMRIPMEKLNTVILPIPTSRLEQQKIADFLDDKVGEIDSVIAKTRETIEDYKKYKQAIITDAVTKGLNPNVEMKESYIDWIGEIPRKWDCLKIKYVTTISRGLFNHRPRNDQRYYNGEYPFIQTGDVANAIKFITTYSQTLNELGMSVSKKFPKGTLTMTIAANVGDVAILGFDAYFPDSVVGFVPNKDVNGMYLYYIFKAMKDKFVRTAIISTQLNLNIERVKELLIPYTSNIIEQQEIVKYLDKKCSEIDKLIVKKEKLLIDLESYKKSLIYEYVTGKKEVE